MVKSADAFRTISEVAEWLETPAHVLRFWESKFSQVKPVKRAGGRRYYRPNDMQLLGGIKKLLHDDGMTIKGVQKILREQGVKHVVSLSQPLDEVTEAEASEMAENVPEPQEDTSTGTVLSFQREAAADKPAKSDTKEKVATETRDKAPAPTETPADTSPDPEPADTTTDSARAEPAPTPNEPTEATKPPTDDSTPVLPSFMHRRSDAPAQQEADAPPAASPEPVKADVPDDPPDDMPAPAGALTALSAFDGSISNKLAEELSELADRLSASVADHRS